MDMDFFTVGDRPYPGYPAGVGPLLGAEGTLSQGYEDLTETEKEHLIMQCKDARTTDDKQRIVDSKVSDMDAKALAEEETHDNSYKDSLK